MHAIVAAAKERSIALTEPAAFDSPTRKGVIGRVESRSVALGAERYLDELGIATSALTSDAKRLRADGVTAIFVAIAASWLGFSGSRTGSRQPDRYR